MAARKLDLILTELQGNVSEPEDLLVASNFADVMEQPVANVGPETEPDNRGSGTFEQYPATIGKWESDFTMAFSLYSLGSDEPDFVRHFEASGWVKTDHDGYARLKPGRKDLHKAMTVWGYKGDPGHANSQLQKWGNVMYDAVITLEGAKKAAVTFTGKGKYIDQPQRATMPDVEAYREREAAPAVINATIEIMGQKYKFIKFELTPNNDVQNNIDASAEFGSGDTETADLNLEWSATVYFQPTSGVLQPHDDLKSGQAGRINFEWGTNHGTPDLQLITGDLGAQLLTVQDGNNNGISTFELTGIILGNDIELRVFNNAASVSSNSTSSASISSTSTSSSSASASSTLVSGSSSSDSLSSSNSESSESSSSVVV